MFLTTRYRKSLTPQVGSEGNEKCARICERICWIGSIVLMLGLSLALYMASDKSLEAVIIASIFLFLGLSFAFCFWMRCLYRESVKRRTRMAQRKDRRTKSEAIIQMSATQQPDATEEIPDEIQETMPLDNPPAYESLKG